MRGTPRIVQIIIRYPVCGVLAINGVIGVHIHNTSLQIPGKNLAF